MEARTAKDDESGKSAAMDVSLCFQQFARKGSVTHLNSHEYWQKCLEVVSERSRLPIGEVRQSVIEKELMDVFSPSPRLSLTPSDP